MAYHVVLHAIEARAGITPISRFWMSLRHARCAHMPYARHHAAGLARAREGVGIGWIENAVADWMSTDLNPAVQAVRLTNSIPSVVSAYNEYNARANLAVRTSMDIADDGVTVARRELVGTHVDPEPCKLATLSVFNMMLSELRARVEHKRPTDVLTVCGTARRLGVQHSATAQAAEVFEVRGGIPVGDVARELGCSQRTLERRLKAEGGSAEEIRVGTRIVSATRMLGSRMSLTEVAHAAGFSDAAHMTRTFTVSCGLAPSFLRRSLKIGDSRPSPRAAKECR